MKNKNLSKLFIGFGIVTVASGIYLIIRGDYVSGISGAIVGVGLIFTDKINAKQQN